MPLDLSDGSVCFIDANVLYYALVDTPPFSTSCIELLKRAGRGDVTAFTSMHLMGEVMHKIMLAEVAARYKLKRASLVNWLQANRNRIAELKTFSQSVRILCALPVKCLHVKSVILAEAADIACEAALLTNDSISVALMRSNNLRHMVTNDDDFDTVPGLTVWKPR